LEHIQRLCITQLLSKVLVQATPRKKVKVLLLKEQVEYIEDLVGTVTQASVNNKQGTNGLDNCGGCGQPVGPVHKSQM